MTNLELSKLELFQSCTITKKPAIDPKNKDCEK
jgi:hypothetical protein